MASWKKTISTPFKKLFTQQQQQQHQEQATDKKSRPEHENRGMDLHGEVMACAYEDVQVMWSILDKSKSPSTCSCNITTS